MTTSEKMSAVEIARCRTSLEQYGLATRGLTAAQHHKGIINAVYPKVGTANSAVVCPPGSGKSTWISEIAPAWLIGRFPEKTILHIHSNDEKANAYLSTLQQVFENNASHQEIYPDVVPDIERGWSGKGLYFKWLDKTGKWRVVDKDGWAHQGSKDPQYAAMGYMGGAIGRRVDLIILDDPFDPAEIESPTFRIRFERRFKTVIRSRLKPGGRIIWVSNRWHHDDMVPKLQDMGFDLVTFQAITEDAMGQEHSYWPEYWDLKELQTIRGEMGISDFNCLYMGVPGGADGSILQKEWFKYCTIDHLNRTFLVPTDEGLDIVPWNQCRWLQAVDPAASTRDSADYFALATVAIDQKGRFYVVDFIRKRLQGPEQPDLIRTAYEQWHPYGIGIEKTAYQLTLVQTCVKLGLPIIELSRSSDKLSRHLALAVHYQNRMVYHLRNASWLKDLETELTQIPLSKHDDMADALADAVNGLTMRRPNISGAMQKLLIMEQHRKIRTKSW